MCGNDRMAVRGLYQEQSYFTPQAKYILATNKLPELNVDKGVVRRLRVVEWMMKYVDEEDFDPNNKYHVIKDGNLDEKIQELEWCQNFMWLLIHEYYPSYVKEGLKEPQEVTKLSKNYMANNDKIGAYLGICTYKTEQDERYQLLKMYEHFQEFYKTRYSQKPPNFDSFIEYLRTNEYKVEEKSMNNIYVYGIRVKEEGRDEDDENNESNEKSSEKTRKKIPM